jgi:outer membrane protein OmpA-like peptidoglycan-associated protein
MTAKLSFAISFLLLCTLGYSQQRYELTQYQGLPANARINDITLGDGISSYVATENGLFYVASVGLEPRHIIPGRSVESISGFSKNNFYFSSGNSYANSLDPTVTHNIGDRTVRIAGLTPVGDDLWLATNNGIYVVNLRNNRVSRHYTQNNSALITRQINFIHRDNYGVIWAGTKNGILRIDDDNWKLYERNHSFEAIAENFEGLWVLSDKELWNIDNISKANRWYKLNLKKDLKRGVVNDLVVDSQSRLIIASDVLVRFDPYTGNIERYGSELGLIAQKCNALAIDVEDRVWIGTNDSGLYTVGFREHLRPSERERIPLEIVMITQQPSCHEENDGSIKLLTKGGTRNLTISWSTGDQNVKSIENLTAGEYSVTVSDTRSDTITKFITLQQPEKLTISIAEVVKNPTDNRSSVNFEIKGGTPGYRLEVDGFISNNPVKDLFPGKHEAEVTDVFGCYAFAEFEIEGEQAFTSLDVSSIKVGQVLQIENIYFLADSVEMTPNSRPVLDEVFQFLTQNEKIVVEIGGHTNNIPPDEYCNWLSDLRAKNIAEYLIKRGIESPRVSYQGYGKRFPIASNDTAEGRRKNQRVELKILSIGM